MFRITLYLDFKQLVCKNFGDVKQGSSNGTRSVSFLFGTTFLWKPFWRLSPTVHLWSLTVLTFFFLTQAGHPFFNAPLCNQAASPLLCAVSDWSNVSAPLRSTRAGADAADSWHRASAERGRQAGPATGAASCVSAGWLFKYRATLSRSSRLCSFS